MKSKRSLKRSNQNSESRLEIQRLRLTVFLSLPILLLVAGCSTNTSGGSSNQLPYGVISPKEAWSQIGKTETVRYHVSKTASSNSGTEFLDEKLNYKSGFVTVIFSNVLDRFPLDPAVKYEGKTIDVTGVIKRYGGYVEIQAFDPSQIHLVG
jgi:DNA/RNA endonuclease YhcR with UshA esterase domain